MEAYYCWMCTNLCKRNMNQRWAICSLLSPQQKLGSRWPTRCRKRAPTHSCRRCLLKVKPPFFTSHAGSRGFVSDDFYIEKWTRVPRTCGRCQRIADAGHRPRGRGLPAGAALRLQALPQLLLPLPQAGGERRASHQPPRLGPCRDQSQVRSRHRWASPVRCSATSGGRRASSNCCLHRPFAVQEVRVRHVQLPGLQTPPASPVPAARGRRRRRAAQDSQVGGFFVVFFFAAATSRYLLRLSKVGLFLNRKCFLVTFPFHAAVADAPPWSCRWLWGSNSSRPPPEKPSESTG